MTESSLGKTFACDAFSMAGDGRQRNSLRQFYDAQWLARRRYVEELIARGETNPYRIVCMLNALERRFKFAQKTYRFQDDVRDPSVVDHVIIEGLPSGAILKAGTRPLPVRNGIATVSPEDVAQLTLTPPPGHAQDIHYIIKIRRRGAPAGSEEIFATAKISPKPSSANTAIEQEPAAGAIPLYISEPQIEVQLEPINFPKEEQRLPSGTPILKTTSLRGHPLVVPFHTQTPIADLVVDFLHSKEPFDCIVELGCGYGRNLIDIYYRGSPRGTRCFGAELSPHGRAMGQSLAKLDTELDITFVPFDFLRPDLSFVQNARRLLVLTVHAIEQVHHIDLQLIRQIAASAPHVTTIHLEPFGFQAVELGPITRSQAEFFTKNTWNVNLYPTLQAAVQQGIIAVDFVAPEIFLPTDPYNPTSMVVWHHDAA